MTLKMLRVRDNLTQEVAAKALGISPSTLSKWESGKSFPDVLDINKIENLYHINYNDIIFLPIDTV
ncbi:helix-turn-helix transcriptional regulator [Streptococcus cristatus]|jgi:DNA-binding helix-turn-helix protein|uniref:helix-turn-helix transcriptional regulator n=1 Tax=Streptococcus cristatus TaxID=45634 RepID=UPI00223BCF55|nr:helix-turn-helix transcriptional regulator [Streptococcus cristatus]